MKIMAVLLAAALLEVPAYVREGNHAEEQFHAYSERLTQFYQQLRATISREVSEDEAAMLLQGLEKEPPPVGVYGYGMLPHIVAIPQPSTPIRTFAYSWPITEGYIKGEASKLDRAKYDLARVPVSSSDRKLVLLSELVRRYRELVDDQSTIDQYIQYNRFWQRSIAESRPRYDRMTQIYHMLKSGNADMADAIRTVLGKPDAPKFIGVRHQGSNRVVLQVPVYTDIDDESYLSQAKTVIENAWRVEDGGTQYAVEIELHEITRRDLYRGRTAPERGAHLDVDKHVARFPDDGGVLTTGAEFTYGSLGRYVALGPGDLTPRTLAHEFGHILGFNDGYVRGYSDLGERGFEILELTSFFDDIMSAPREGHVEPAHFKLLLEALKR